MDMDADLDEDDCVYVVYVLYVFLFHSSFAYAQFFKSDWLEGQ